ncbi:FAD-dependent thymidylate synthase [Moorella sulfitireducens (nom. illeg.)]|uniref:FAD-dependent thymidylate synthase n=1 Tax=Neomoorella sulfitireducens TaxID=2972948 RepID=UPI0021AD1A1D|nr:FAD-dependent thymidylate synthase [Moorella sulfitireducens]
MHVELISHTPEPERLVAAAARLCYSPHGAGRLLDAMEKDEVERLLRLLISMGHESPLEHITFTFAIEGVSRVLSHQLVRHRIASYSQKSQRYVNEDNFTYIIPPSVAAVPEALVRYQECMRTLQKAYHEIQELVPREDARYLLPNACETKLVCTFNARSLFNFFRLRCCNRAQWEIRELALKMREQVRRVAPLIFSHAGPDCETEGVCHEGTMSCGRAPAARTREES